LIQSFGRRRISGRMKSLDEMTWDVEKENERRRREVETKEKAEKDCVMGREDIVTSSIPMIIQVNLIAFSSYH
jgi:hypothetical protein